MYIIVSQLLNLGYIWNVMAKSVAYIVAFLAISVYFLFIKKKNTLPAAYDGKFLPEFRTVAELFRYESSISWTDR